MYVVNESRRIFMYYNYNLFMQSLDNLVKQLEQSNNESDKKILDTLKKTIDALKSVSELNQNETQAFLNLLSFSVGSSVVLTNNQQ